MITELLVLIACTNGHGCSQSTAAYYSSNPEFKRLLDRNKKQVAKVVGPEIVLLSPVVMLISNGIGTFRLSKHISAHIATTGNKSLVFELTF